MFRVVPCTFMPSVRSITSRSNVRRTITSSSSFSHSAGGNTGDDGSVANSRSKLEALLDSFRTDNVINTKRKSAPSGAKNGKHTAKNMRRSPASKNTGVSRAKNKMESIIGERMTSAVRDVVSSMKEPEERRAAEMDLLKQLCSVSDNKSAPSGLDALLDGIQIQSNRRQQRRTYEEHDGISGDSGGRSWRRSPAPRGRTEPLTFGANKVITLFRHHLTQVNIDGGKRLNIFSPEQLKKSQEQKSDTMWGRLQQRQLQLVTTTAPQTAWHQMAEWTRTGRLWPLPLDNELGAEEEAAVGFQDHVLLERHLEPWCPRRGAVRKFMELVCIGLSKNHHFTVEEKRDHIAWYKEYFISKRTLLEELDCFPPEQKSQAEHSA